VSTSADGQVLIFRASAPSAGAAQQAADAYAAAFRQLSSDAADRQLASAQQSLQDQMRQLDRSLAARDLSTGERNVLIARRSDYAAALNRLLVRRELLSGGQALVVSPAKAPTASDSRHVALHTGMGLVLGLVVAAIVAALVDRREDRVRSEHDLLQRLGEGPNGVDLTLVPLTAPQRKGAGRHGDDGLPARAGSPEADAFAVLRASLTTAATGPIRVVLVAEAVRTTGAAAPCLNLAAAFSRGGRRTVVTSLDFREDSDRQVMEKVLTPADNRSRKIVRLPRAHDEAGAEAADERTGSEVTRLFPLTFRTVPGEENLALVASGELKGSEDLVAGRPVESFLESLVGIADVALLEVAPVMTYPDAMLVWPYCHDALLVVQIGQSRTGDVLRAVERLTHRGQRTAAVVVLGPSRGGAPGPLRALLVPATPADHGRDLGTPWPAREAVEPAAAREPEAEPAPEPASVGERAADERTDEPDGEERPEREPVGDDRFR
jgi:Mrp family chromosome partitioning ATPase